MIIIILYFTSVVTTPVQLSCWFIITKELKFHRNRRFHSGTSRDIRRSKNYRNLYEIATKSRIWDGSENMVMVRCMGAHVSWKRSGSMENRPRQHFWHQIRNQRAKLIQKSYGKVGNGWKCGECFAPICAHVSRRHVHSAISSHLRPLLGSIFRAQHHFICRKMHSESNSVTFQT